MNSNNEQEKLIYKKRSIFDPQDGNKPIVLKNKTCLYCGITLDKKSTREHVIGKHFVPDTDWSTHWNLIAQACADCNNHKSKLENDISAITMQEHLNDPTLKAKAERKGLGSKSARTGKPVSSSIEYKTIDVPFAPGINFKFKMQAPPQIDDKRAFELARLQMNAFFYLVTYNQEQKLGKFIEGKFSPIACYPKSNWGNQTKKAFMVLVQNWEHRLVGITAEGYFKVMMKKHPSENCFAWALEWNLSHRVYGFFGNRKLAEEIFKGLPQASKEKVPLRGDEYLMVSQDETLPKDEDTLFQIGSNL